MRFKGKDDISHPNTVPVVPQDRGNDNLLQQTLFCPDLMLSGVLKNDSKIKVAGENF